MCVVLIGWNAVPDFKLILAANRDEYYNRATDTARFWDDAPSILAGRDKEKGGTWLGITRQGRFAAVTNIRRPSAKKSDPLSRGLLVSDYLRSELKPREYLNQVAEDSHQYNLFNLIVADENSLVFLSAVDKKVISLSPGIYGISNDMLDSPWPKVIKGKSAMAALINEGKVDSENLLTVLQGKESYADEELPNTGVGIEMERLLSPVFVHTNGYGSRSSTVILMGNSGAVDFTECSFDEHGNLIETVKQRM